MAKKGFEAMRTRTTLIGLGCALLLAATVQAGDTLESVEKRLGAQWEKLSSMSARFDLVRKEIRDGVPMTTSGQGKFESLKYDDRRLYRTDLDSRTQPDDKSTKGISEKSATMIDDGVYLYTLSTRTTRPVPAAVKMVSQPGGLGGNGKAMLGLMRKTHDLRLLPDQSISKQACYVVEATRKGAPRGGAVRKMIFFRRADGIVLEMRGFDARGEQIMTMTYRDIKLNPKIDPRRFIFKAPPGVKIVDRTK